MTGQTGAAGGGREEGEGLVAGLDWLEEEGEGMPNAVEREKV